MTKERSFSLSFIFQERLERMQSDSLIVISRFPAVTAGNQVMVREACKAEPYRLMRRAECIELMLELIGRDVTQRRAFGSLKETKNIEERTCSAHAAAATADQAPKMSRPQGEETRRS